MSSTPRDSSSGDPSTEFFVLHQATSSENTGISCQCPLCFNILGIAAIGPQFSRCYPDEIEMAPSHAPRGMNGEDVRTGFPISYLEGPNYSNIATITNVVPCVRQQLSLTAFSSGPSMIATSEGLVDTSSNFGSGITIPSRDEVSIKPVKRYPFLIKP